MLCRNIGYNGAAASKKDTLSRSKGKYRIIKPENILIDYEGHLILGDFGLCRINLEKEELTRTHCGSP